MKTKFVVVFIPTVLVVAALIFSLWWRWLYET